MQLSDVVAEMVICLDGDPMPQGSKSGFVPPHPYVPKNGKCGGGRAVITEKIGARHKHWRQLVSVRAVEAMRLHQSRHGIPWPRSYDGPVKVRIVFVMPRPKAAKKAERWAWKRPDIDKLARSVLDSLDDADVYRDDGRVVHLTVDKLYVGPDGEPPVRPGCTIHVALIV